MKIAFLLNHSLFISWNKRRKPAIRVSSCSGGGADGGNNATVGHPVSADLLSAAPAIHTTSGHPETPEKREALTYETMKPYGRVQASTGYRPRLYRASVRRWRHIWLWFHWKVTRGDCFAHVYPSLGNDSVNTFSREPTRARIWLYCYATIQ
jgi:hypothetical protein